MNQATSNTPAAPAAAGALNQWKRALLMGLAVLSLGLAIVGVFVPGLPSTEFVLLAAWASARSSPRLHAWLHRHRLFGPMLHNWKNGSCVARANKIAATISMSLCVVLMHYTVPHPWFVWSAAACMALVLMWIWSRPERAATPAPEAA